MNIRVRNSEGEVESREYVAARETGREDGETTAGDVAKLLALKRDLMVKGPEAELRVLGKNTALMKKTILQVKEICQMQQ
jgi:hypothetical protein